MNAEQVLQDSYQLLRKGDPTGAEQALAPLWNANESKPPKAMHLLALIRRAQTRIPEAEQWLRAAIEAEPNDPEQHANLGDLLLNSGFHQTAAESFERAVQLAPTMDAAKYGLARAYNLLGRGEEAERIARDLLTRQRAPEALRVLGGALGVQGRHAEALQLFDEALTLRPNYRGVQHDRALALHKLGRTEEALAILRALAEKMGATPELILSWASVLLDEHRLDEAEELLMRGAAASPSNVKLQSDLARLRWMRGWDSARFAADMERAVALYPDHEVMRSACSELLYRAGRSPDAEAMVREGLQRSPDSLGLWGMLGFLQDERDASQEAVVSLERAYALAKDLETLKLLVHAYLRTNQPDRALEHIRFALKLTPNDQVWLAYLATAQRMRGDPEFNRLYDLNTCVRVIDLAPPPGYADIVQFNAALGERLDAQHVLSQHPLNQTLRDGTQTARDLTEVGDPVIDQFIAMAQQAVREFSASLPSDPTHPFHGRRAGDIKFNGCWSVKLRPGGKHVNHVHTKGWISSAYYVRLPQHDPSDAQHAGWFKLGEPRIPIPGCSALGHVEPKIGRLVLFPSYMWHGTEPFAKGDRLTIAFDAVPV